MTGEANSAGFPLSPPDVAVTGGGFSGARFAGVMGPLRAFLRGPKYEAVIADLEASLGVSRRTAERIYAGRAVGAEAVFAVLTDATLGPALLEEILGRVPAARRADAAAALARAVEVVRLKAEQDLLAARLAALRQGSQ